ncbi:MAG: pyridoxamine 5'-phosphate oxidase [Phycisphaerales bacterium]|nr:pyridoxamine 5'-phosphate oxidase [Phycisphaerales bacterium]
MPFDVSENLPDPLPESPWPIFRRWFDEAVAARLVPNPNAFCLASCVDDRPSARIVLCRAIEDHAIVFFTNYESRKGQELLTTGRAAACFHFDHQDRQVRLEGTVEKVAPEQSDAYFNSRAIEKRIGAWASAQSRPIESRDALLAKVMETMTTLGVTLDEDEVVPRPPHWGGLRLVTDAIELWCSGEGRIHDRARWTRTTDTWSATRLQP